MTETTIEFLEIRGFRVTKVEHGYNIEIGHRSIGAGLNEVFVESDELKAIGQLGRLTKIILYGDNIIRMSVRRETMQTKKTQREEKKEIPAVEERVQAKIEEKGKGDTL